jgi:hypothetical protein
MNKPSEGDLRVWWIPQVPGNPFHVPVKTVREASVVLETLTYYDLFQFGNNIKPDYSNAGGLEVFEKSEWTEWYDEESGEFINDLDEERQTFFGIDESIRLMWVGRKTT